MRTRGDELDSRSRPTHRTRPGPVGLVVIDMQIDFVDGGASPIAGTSEVLPAIGRLLEAHRAAQVPIVHVVRFYDGDDVDLARRAAVAAGAPIVRPGSAPRSSRSSAVQCTRGRPTCPASRRPTATRAPRMGDVEAALGRVPPDPRSIVGYANSASQPWSSPDATTPTALAPPSTAPANATTAS